MAFGEALAWIEGWLARSRERARLRRSAAADPVQAALTDLCIRADDSGIEALALAQAEVVLAWGARGVIGNGGFRAFYQGSGDMRAVARAFRTLGFPEAAAACEASTSAFPLGAPPGDLTRRQDACAGIDWEELRDAERAVHAVGWEALLEAVGAHMRRHPRDFPGIQ